MSDRRGVQVLRIVVAIVLMMGVLAWSNRGRLYRWLTGGPVSTRTVAERLEQYGPRARERLGPYFAAAGIAYPPQELVLVGIKESGRLEVWAATEGEAGRRWRLVRTYAIIKGSGRLGPKLREGDHQVPEGLYGIESLNPNSRFHLALRVNYPNAFDRQKAAEEGRDRPGSDIMIHGSNVSVGCLAMGDEAAEDLFVLAADVGLERVRLILTPVDFRRRELPQEAAEGLPAWTGELYEQIQAELGELR